MKVKLMYQNNKKKDIAKQREKERERERERERMEAKG